jgi:hypothetical protein
MLPTSRFRDRPAFGFQHGAQLLNAPIERNALVVDLRAEDLAVVLDTEPEANEPFDGARRSSRQMISRSAFVTRQSVRSWSPRCA